MRIFYPQVISISLLMLTIHHATAQAKLVINGGIVTVNNGASLVIDNPDNTAIMYTGSGYIQSEGAGNNVVWSIGPGNGNTYLVPFGNATDYFPLQLNAASATGAGGRFVFSTYATPTWKNSDYLPPGVTNVNSSGVDNSAKVMDRFWQISALGYTVKPTLSNLVFTYADADHQAPNTIAEANLIPQRWNSTLLRWDDYLPSAAINTINNTVTLPTVPGNQLFDWWTLVDTNFALPLTLLGFTAAVKNKAVVTSWQTVAEKNTSYFEVWRSMDMQRFEVAGSVAAAGTSYGTLDYAFTDTNPYTGASWYRLKCVDLNGKFTWSPVVKTIINASSFSLFPNPAKTYLNLTVSAAIAATKPTALIYDSKGSLVQTTRITAAWQALDISLLSAGLYRIQFMYNGKPQTLSFIKN